MAKSDAINLARFVDSIAWQIEDSLEVNNFAYLSRIFYDLVNACAPSDFEGDE